MECVCKITTNATVVIVLLSLFILAIIICSVRLWKWAVFKRRKVVESLNKENMLEANPALKGAGFKAVLHERNFEHHLKGCGCARMVASMLTINSIKLYTRI